MSTSVHFQESDARDGDRSGIKIELPCEAENFVAPMASNVLGAGYANPSVRFERGVVVDIADARANPGATCESDRCWVCRRPVVPVFWRDRRIDLAEFASPPLPRQRSASATRRQFRCWSAEAWRLAVAASESPGWRRATSRRAVLRWSTPWRHCAANDASLELR